MDSRRCAVTMRFKECGGKGYITDKRQKLLLLYVFS